jgi:hypothetical protein
VPTENKPKEDFGLVVKASLSAVKIYRDRKGSGDYFRLAYYLGGKRQGGVLST